MLCGICVTWLIICKVSSRSCDVILSVYFCLLCIVLSVVLLFVNCMRLIHWLCMCVYQHSTVSGCLSDNLLVCVFQLWWGRWPCCRPTSFRCSLSCYTVSRRNLFPLARFLCSTSYPHSCIYISGLTYSHTVDCAITTMRYWYMIFKLEPSAFGCGNVQFEVIVMDYVYGKITIYSQHAHSCMMVCYMNFLRSHRWWQDRFCYWSEHFMVTNIFVMLFPLSRLGMLHFSVDDELRKKA